MKTGRLELRIDKDLLKELDESIQMDLRFDNRAAALRYMIKLYNEEVKETYKKAE